VPKGPSEPSDLDAGDGFARFTLRARDAVMAAQDAARAAGNDRIGAAHLLLGLLHEPEALAAKAIEAQGVDLTRLGEAAAPVCSTASGWTSRRPKPLWRPPSARCRSVPPTVRPRRGSRGSGTTVV